MRSHTRRIQRAAFGMGLLAALGFGAVQATAAPQRGAAPQAACTASQSQYCRDKCAQQGWDGYCRNGLCYCY
jgi:hypothetical protein